MVVGIIIIGLVSLFFAASLVKAFDRENENRFSALVCVYISIFILGALMLFYGIRGFW